MSESNSNDAASAPRPTSAVPKELQCQYGQTNCYAERAIKENGERHLLCDYHRDKANEAQRRSAKKKRDENRRDRLLQLAQEQAAVTGVPVDTLINSSTFQNFVYANESNLLLQHEMNNQVVTGFHEEDLEWLREALSSWSSE